MEIRKELVKNAVMEYVEETFANMEFNLSNMGSLVVAKIFVDRNLDTYLDMLSDSQGNVPVDLIEKYGGEAIRKLKMVEIPKIGGKLLFKEEDFMKLMNKIKSKGNM